MKRVAKSPDAARRSPGLSRPAASRSSVASSLTATSRPAAAGTGFDSDRASRWLIDQYARRAVFAPLPAAIAPGSLVQAYAVQSDYAREKALACGPAVGWKIALASPAMQQMTGLRAPIMGRLHQEQLVHSPAITRATDYGRLIVEFEVAVRLGRDLPAQSRPYDAQSVAPAVASMAPALELADDRNADYSLLAGRGLVLIAENAWNQGAVLGEWRDDWARLQHENLRGEAFINGDCVGSGSSADLMGAPLKALAWLANEAIARGACMRAGEIAILGSMVTSKFPVAGDRIEYRLQGFEPVLLALG